MWIVLCVSLAVLVLINSIREYRFVARKVMLDEVRRDVGRSAVALERELQRSTSDGKPNLPEALQKQFEENGKRGWLELRSLRGDTLARVGMNVPATFTEAQVHQSLRDHEPLFKTRETSAGEALVELFTLHIRSHRPGFNAPPASAAGDAILNRLGPPSPPLLEIGMPLSEIRAQFWPLRRGLIIDLSAAIALLVSVVLVAFRYRAFDRARQLEQQLEIARQVQQTLLSSAKQVKGAIELAAECVPAWHVGGDFYDMYPTKGGMALVLGDVSGKGVPAALLAGLLQGAIRVRDWHSSPANHEEAARELNQLLLERASGDRYVTLFWCYYDDDDHRLHYINAGHCPPLLIRRTSAEDVGLPTYEKRLNSEVETLEEGGTVLGLLAAATYHQASVLIMPGDLLVIFSDGVVEATNDRNEEFGTGRLSQLLLNDYSEPVENLSKTITAHIRQFVGTAPLADDLTFLLARFEPAPAMSTPAEQSDVLRVG